MNPIQQNIFIFLNVHLNATSKRIMPIRARASIVMLFINWIDAIGKRNPNEKKKLSAHLILQNIPGE